MSLDKAIAFGRRLKTVTVRESGPAPMEGEALRTELQKNYKKGYEDAAAKYNAEILEMRRQMQEHAGGVLKNIEEGFERLSQKLALELVDLLGALVYKIIGEGAMEPSVLKSRIESVTKESCPENEPVEVQLCPRDFEALKGIDEKFMTGHARLVFKTNDQLQGGDCLMRTRFGEVDARLKTQFKQLIGELSNT